MTWRIAEIEMCLCYALCSPARAAKWEVDWKGVVCAEQDQKLLPVTHVWCTQTLGTWEDSTSDLPPG